MELAYANDGYSVVASGDTGYRVVFKDGIASLYDKDGQGICEFMLDNILAVHNANKIIGKLEARGKYLMEEFVLADKAYEVKKRAMERINEIDVIIETIKSGLED